MTRVQREQRVEFACANEDCGGAPTWMVEGRFNADGEFEVAGTDEPWMGSDMDCPECGELGEPTDSDVRVAREP